MIPPEGIQLLLDLYDGEVARADAALRELVQAWTASGRQGVVVVTSDHGEYFGEHGLLEHGRTVWKEVVDVPLVLAAPGRFPAGATVTLPVQLQDVYPTVLELAGLANPTWSLVDALAGVPRPGAIQAAEWPDDDPRMTHDLAGVLPGEVTRLHLRADAAFPEAPAAAGAIATAKNKEDGPWGPSSGSRRAARRPRRPSRCLPGRPGWSRSASSKPCSSLRSRRRPRRSCR